MPSRSNYICVKCEKEMMPVKVGVLVEEHRAQHEPVRIVEEHDQKHNFRQERQTEWLSYKIWTADVLQCPECGAQILAGFPDRPVAHHHEDHYAEEQKKVEFHIR